MVRPALRTQAHGCHDFRAAENDCVAGVCGMKNNLHDPACYDLACHFLGAAPEHLKDELAQHIQDSIEDWLRAEQQSIEMDLKP
jgi:hypothetical protein